MSEPGVMPPPPTGLSGQQGSTWGKREYTPATWPCPARHHGPSLVSPFVGGPRRARCPACPRGAREQGCTPESPGLRSASPGRAYGVGGGRDLRYLSPFKTSASQKENGRHVSCTLVSRFSGASGKGGGCREDVAGPCTAHAIRHSAPLTTCLPVPCRVLKATPASRGTREKLGTPERT